jgi:hypothetical protein
LKFVRPAEFVEKAKQEEGEMRDWPRSAKELWLIPTTFLISRVRFLVLRAHFSAIKGYANEKNNNIISSLYSY